MRLIRLLPIFLTGMLAFSCTLRPEPATTTPQGEGFAIYLTAQNVPVSEMEARSYVEPADETLITAADIFSYDWDTHEIELTSTAVKKLRNLQIPTNGTAFLVCVDRQPVYWGAFWVLYSSLSFDGVVIMQPLGDSERTIQIARGYPGTSFASGGDPRNDQKIRDSLAKAGKLRESATTAIVEQPDDIVATPGGLAHRANVHQQGVPDRWPSIETVQVALGTASDNIQVRYRNAIEMKAGQTRNNLLHVFVYNYPNDSPEARTPMMVKVNLLNAPPGLSMMVGQNWRGPAPGMTSQLVVKLHCSSDLAPGSYMIELSLSINGRDVGKLLCNITVIK